jgi:hypothetical protein
MLKGPGLGILFGTGIVNLAIAQNLAAFDGQYMGELVLTREISGDCTRPPPGALYPLRITECSRPLPGCGRELYR